MLCPQNRQKQCAQRLGNWSFLVMRSANHLITEWSVPKGYALKWVGGFHHRYRIQFEPSGYLDGQQGHFSVYSRDGSKRHCRIDVSNFNVPHGQCA